MNETGSHAGETAVDAIHVLRLESERCRRELDSSRQRVGELEHGERLLAGENRLLAMVARGAPLSEILTTFCQLIEELCPGSLCGILLYDRANNRVEHGAAPGLPKAYNDAIHHRTVTRDAGPCGTALCLKEQVIAADIATDPRWDAGDWRRLALAHDLRACWSTPILSCDGDALGTFAIYWREVRSPAARDQKLLAQVSHLAAVSVDRRQAEADLRRSQAYLTEAQRLSRTGSFGWKPATGELIWSDETFRIMGYDPASRPTVEMVFARVHPQDLSLLKETMAGAVRGLSDFELEHRLLFADGLIKHVHVVARWVKDGAGDLEYVGALMDITGQKRLENQLRSSERNLAEGQRLTKTGSWILDYKTGNTDWSVETCRIFGFPDPPPSPHYREFRARVRFEDREGVDRGLQESFERGEPRPLKYVFILPDGTRKNIETISEPVRDESGKVVKLMGTVMDVTERQTAEDALRASELLARGQIDALTSALDVMARESAPDKIVEQVLRSFTTQLEAHSSSVWRRDEASGLMIFEFALEEGDFRTKANAQLASISPTLRIEDVWLWPEIFRTGKPHLLEDIREGSEFPWRANLVAQGVVSILTVPMLISGLVVGVIGIRFTSKRKFRREELELSQALTNQVTLATQLIRLSEQSREAAVIAERNRMARDIHDALAQGFTGVIVQLEAAEDAASKDLTAEARNHLARAGKMARYGLSEARRSVRALRLQGLEDNDLCSALDALFRRMTTDTGLHSEFALRGVPQSLPSEWEENLLRIAQEVVTNALRHAAATHFKARLHFEAQRLSLELRDDGCGFDPELKRDGFGMVGMRERVDQMGGQIVIQSAVGAGTTIAITLPLTGDSQPSES